MRFKFSVIIVNENHSKPTREYPYTHRIDRGNTHFQIMQKNVTWLENTFVGTGWSWKPHKSKEHNFLHRNYTPKFFSTPKKNLKFFRSKKMFDFFSSKKFSRKIRPKIKNFRFSGKIENLTFSIFGRIFFRIFFRRKFSGFFLIENFPDFFSELRYFFEYSFDVKNVFFRFMRFSGPSGAHKCVF